MIQLLDPFDILALLEAENPQKALAKYERLTMEILDIDKFVKVNDCKEIYDPVFFNGPTPSEHGLLSNEIFGITKTERAGIFAYIYLGGVFIQPLVYKTLCKLNSKIPEIINGTDTFRIDDNGEIVQDPNGNTGIVWFKKVFNSIKFKETESRARKLRIKFIQDVKNKMWIDKFIVIPAYYRDVDTKEASLGVGEVNSLYSSLIIASKSLKETAEYGLTLAETNRARVQNILVQLFDWFGAGTTINGQETTGNLPGKTGLIKRGILYKTVDYSVRLVMSAAKLDCERIDDMMVNMDYAAEPLAAAICNFKPFILFWLRRFFENQYAGVYEHPIMMSDGNVYQVPIEDYQILFSDVELDKQIERFIHGYSNRFIPVNVPINYEEYIKICKENKLKITPKEEIYMSFRGRLVDMNTTLKDLDDIEKYPISVRPLTWCDLFYMAACEVTKDKMVLITRFPIDSYLNQLPSKIRIKSTVKTQPMLINNEIYKWYPVIRAEDINTNTSALFSDTLSICNGLIDVMSLDFDGDTAIVKPVYTIEANEECARVAKSKVQMIGMDGISPRIVTKENVMLLYTLTNQPDNSINLIDPQF